MSPVVLLGVLPLLSGPVSLFAATFFAIDGFAKFKTEAHIWPS
jgi:hypothetical protein